MGSDLPSTIGQAHGLTAGPKTRYRGSVPRCRLDQLLVDRGLVGTRSQAAVLIRLGRVRVGGQIVDKPGTLIPAEAAVELLAEPLYVSRAAIKLEAALDRFGIDPRNWICLDVGASTGGFTQVLLRRGARRVYAVDVGYGQLDWSLRNDPRVVCMERTDIRAVETLGEAVDLGVIDVAFISLRLVLPAVQRLLAPHGLTVALVKPQFEAGRHQVPRGGVVRDVALQRQVLERIFEWAVASGWCIANAAPSPIPGQRGNREFFCLLTRRSDTSYRLEVAEAVARALGDERPSGA